MAWKGGAERPVYCWREPKRREACESTFDEAVETRRAPNPSSGLKTSRALKTYRILDLLSSNFDLGNIPFLKAAQSWKRGGVGGGGALGTAT
jgi:hypothetical protein